MRRRKLISAVLILFGFGVAIIGKYTMMIGFLFFIIGVFVNLLTDRTIWRKLLWVIIPIVLWKSSMIGVWYLKGKSVSQKDTYIFPIYFRGKAIIVYNMKTGKPLLIRGNRRVFKFDSTGILFTQAKEPKGIIDREIYFQATDGKLTQLLAYSPALNTNSIERDSDSIKVFGFDAPSKGYEGGCEYKFYELKVGSLAEADTIDRTGSIRRKMHALAGVEACKN